MWKNMIYSPAINAKIGSTEYWEIQEWLSWFVSQLCVRNNSSDFRELLDFLLARSQNKVGSQMELFPRELKGDRILHAVFHVSTVISPAEGRTKFLSTNQRSQIHSGTTGLSLGFPRFQILHSLRWGRTGMAIRTQVPTVLTNKAHVTHHAASQQVGFVFTWMILSVNFSCSSRWSLVSCSSWAWSSCIDTFCTGKTWESLSWSAGQRDRFSRKCVAKV